MTRSPLFYPLNRGMEAEAGGVADLQTDVMRFIAILALCLVAIFALVQSIPLLPTFIETPTQNPTPAPQPVTQEAVTTRQVSPEPKAAEQTAQQIAKRERPLVITRSAPKRVPIKTTPQTIIEQAIAAQPVATLPEQDTVEQTTPDPAPLPTSPTREGFTLRFETDLALTRLVARHEVGLYAITPEKSVRMNVNRGALSFWAASTPNQFHEMDETTVPDEVLQALRRAGSVKLGDVKWGVTLPSDMRRQLDQYLNGSDGGSLIIGGDGSLRLEP